MKTVLSLFLESAEKFSNSTALVCDNKNYTYREINSISNRFAHLLHTKYDLKKNDVVLFHFKRSYEAVITLLSLLKLGCTYVPIVKEFGQARIEFIHGFVEPRLVISDTMGAISKGPLLCYPELVDEIKSYPDTPLPDISTELDPLCILFTSGSTGMPKGVLIHNKGIVNRINWMLREQPIQSGEYSFQNTKFTTVDSLWEIFAPLVSGNPLLILDDDIVNNPQLLIEQLVQYPVH